MSQTLYDVIGYHGRALVQLWYWSMYMYLVVHTSELKVIGDLEAYQAGGVASTSCLHLSPWWPMEYRD